MGLTPVSVVVVSRGRAEALSLCLTALGQIHYHPFEIVVVADPPGCAAARRHELGDRLKVIPFDRPNIARARNLGIDAAGGEIVAFIDDDAFAEPGWLIHLTSVFADPQVAGAGGFVLGRNGFSLQWGARIVSPEGWQHSIETPVSSFATPNVPEGAALRTEGTNMAFRRRALRGLGGFDEAFRYYFDETDLNMRMAKAGLRIALAPLARVWHRQDASPRRRSGRTPRDLSDIGASTAAFLRRHGHADRFRGALAAHRNAERSRLLRHMVRGALMPGDVDDLLGSFDEGVEDGASRPVCLMENQDRESVHQPLRQEATRFEPKVISGWAWERERLNTSAEAAIDAGNWVHLLRLTPTTLFHRRSFAAPGIWLQTGGIFGRSARNTPLWRASTLNMRAKV
ncbi:MAG: glycosyltransferase, partial [Pseudomonadota bacterium]